MPSSRQVASTRCAGDDTVLVVQAHADLLAPALSPLPPDLAVCPACMADVRDPLSPFAGYPFTSCTACGPRYSITQALPFDRARTSMADFALCPSCDARYDDPEDRRWHAQTLSCPRCGPRLWLADPQGSPLPSVEPIADAGRRLLAGQVLGVMGLGGVHLICDATQEDAVRMLRSRKRRDAKPFAVLVADLEMAAAYADLDRQAAAELGQPACPIVLLPRRVSDLAPGVCAGSARVGLMLPYTPLHHMLIAQVGRPLVMTSGNLAGEPIAIDPRTAVPRLGPLVDGFLLHSRAILRRAEDSVVQPTAMGIQILRRARGYAPRPLHLPKTAPEPILALGGHLKNTVCIVCEDRAYLSPHLGDLETVESEQAWRREVENLERLLGVQPQVLAHDLHPDYLSTRYAHARPARRRIGVQHHTAHVLAAVAELHLTCPVLGVAFDGSGWGPDGTSWGAEILHVDGLRVHRLASLRPLRLPGGEAAIREVWRQALALLFDAFGDEVQDLVAKLKCLHQVPAPVRTAVLGLLQKDVRCVLARGVGRYFDAVGALVLGSSRAQYEAQVALALEQHATSMPAEPYPWQVRERAPNSEAGSLPSEIDLRPTTRAIVDDLLQGTAVPQIATRFHATIAAATLQAVHRAQADTGTHAVVLTGGVLQNRWLLAALRQGLGDAARLARQVPVNDGGLALGQAYAAVIALQTLQPHEV